MSGALQYDVRGLVLNETLDVAQPSGTGVMSRTVSHEYDAAGMVKKMTYPGASQTGGLDYEVGRDSAGRLLDLTLTANAISQKLAAYRYEGRQVTGREVYNPASGAAVAALTRTYDGMRRSLTRQETANSGGAAFLARERRYDPMGNVTLAYDAVRGVGEVFRYDSLYRMTSTRWDVPNDGSQLLSLPNHQSLNAGYEGLIANPVISGRKDYTLDAVGNWENVDETLPGTPLQSIDYAFNNFNEITTRNGDSFVYGASGNIQEEPTVQSPDGRFYYEYDFANRLIRACSGGPCVGNDATTIARYYYDALGRRVRKVLVQNGPDDVTDYVLSGAQIIEERKVLSGGTDELKRRFFYRDAVNGLVGMDDFDAAGNSQRYYFHRDEQGSVVAVTRGDGAAWDGSNHARTLRYGAYGQLLADSDPGSAVEVPFRYTGHYFDQETGLYYMRARYYRPEMGRFLSRDPLGYIDGMNLFAYVGNSPATFVDPFGTDQQKEEDKQNRGDDMIAALMGASPFDLMLAREARKSATVLIRTIWEEDPPKPKEQTNPDDSTPTTYEVNRVETHTIYVANGNGGWTDVGSIEARLTYEFDAGPDGRVVVPDAADNPFDRGRQSQEFWLYATTPQMRDNIQEAQKVPGVPVATADWAAPDDPNFAHIRRVHVSLLLERKNNGRLLRDAEIRTMGAHEVNLRFGHIHLTYDVGKNGGRDPNMHWDRIDPVNSLLGHFVEVIHEGVKALAGKD